MLEKRFTEDREKFHAHWKLKPSSSYATEVNLVHRKSLFASGAVISAPNFFASHSQSPHFIKKFVRIIKPQVVVVLDHEALYIALKDTQDCRVLHIPRTGGAVMASEEQEKLIRNFKFDSYFFDERFMCNRDQVPINQLPIYQLVKADAVANDPAFRFNLVKVDPLAVEVSKNVLGVLSLQHKQLQVVISNSSTAAAEGVLKSSLISLIYLFELKGQEQGVGGQPTDAVIIRPTTLQKSYVDMVWILGEHKYQHS